MDCRRPAGWCGVLQSSAHAQLHPLCSPNPAADSPDPPEEFLQTSQSEERNNKEIILLKLHSVVVAFLCFCLVVLNISAFHIFHIIYY